MKKILPFQLLIGVLFLLAACDNNAQEQFGGLALYTLREAMADNPRQTLREAADAGYAYVEAAGYDDGKFYGMAPEEFKNYLSETGLEPLSTHQGTVTLDNAGQMIADVKAAGFKYFVIPVPPMGHFRVDPETRAMSMSDSVVFVTEVLNTVGKQCKEAGLMLLYHNHDFEFKKNADGIVPIEYFLENTDPANVNFQMDLFWVTKAGADPVAYFEKYPGRFKAWHVKDMDEQGRFAPVGTGTIDFGRILEKKAESGMEYYFVEQDQTFDQEPLEAIRISHEGLKRWGFR